MQSSSFTTDIHRFYHGYTLLIHTWLFTHTLGDRLSGRCSFSDPVFQTTISDCDLWRPHKKQQCSIMCTDYTESVHRQTNEKHNLFPTAWFHVFGYTWRIWISTYSSHRKSSPTLYWWTHKATGAFQWIQKCLLGVDIWTQSDLKDLK